MAGSLALDGGHIPNLDKDKPYAEVSNETCIYFRSN